MAAGGYKFEVLDELPPSKRPSRIKNPGRAAVSAAARTHKGKWIPYPPTAVDPYKHPSTTATQAREGKAGFGPGLDAAVRQKQLYISYVGEGQ